jgi:hypothetical protein
LRKTPKKARTKMYDLRTLQRMNEEAEENARRQRAENAAQSILMGGDGTYTIRSGDRVTMSAGCMVGGTVKGLEGPTVSELVEWLQGLDVGACVYVGSWADSSGVIHIDACDHIDTLAQALFIGGRRGEDCVWEWDATRENGGLIHDVPKVEVWHRDRWLSLDDPNVQGGL